MRTETEGSAEWRAAMNAALGSDARLFAIIARGGFALRYGPLSLEQCDDLVELGENEHFPVMITADCGALPDADLAMSLFGETRRDRAALQAKQFQRGEDMMTALQTLCECVDFLLMQAPGRRGSRLEGLREAFKPIDALAEEMTANRPRTIQTTAEIRHAQLHGGGLCPNCGWWGPRHALGCMLAPKGDGVTDDTAALQHTYDQDWRKNKRSKEMRGEQTVPLHQTVDADEATLSPEDQVKRDVIATAVMLASVKGERMVNRFLMALNNAGFDVVRMPSQTMERR